MGAKEDWGKVFKAAVALAKELRKKNPNLKFPMAMKQAWKDDKIKKMKDEFNKKHKGGAEKSKRRTVRKRSATKKRSVTKKRSTSVAKKVRKTKKARSTRRKTGSC
jgi:hypothetical protein